MVISTEDVESTTWKLTEQMWRFHKVLETLLLSCAEQGSTSKFSLMGALWYMPNFPVMAYQNPGKAFEMWELKEADNCLILIAAQILQVRDVKEKAVARHKGNDLKLGGSRESILARCSPDA